MQVYVSARARIGAHQQSATGCSECKLALRFLDVFPLPRLPLPSPVCVSLSQMRFRQNKALTRGSVRLDALVVHPKTEAELIDEADVS